MNLCSPNYVRQVLSEIDFSPGKSMGQNFLVDANILQLIAKHADIGPDDQVVEVGPGLGTLTEALVAKAERVIAIEKDRKLHSFLEDRFAQVANLELRNADALQTDWQEIASGGARKFVSNLPYSVASRILVDIFRMSPKLDRIVVMLQSDVAARMVAECGGRERGLMSVLAQRCYRVDLVKHVGPNCFIPRPRVGSSIVVCRVRERPLADVDDEDFFLRIVKMTFTHRRKTIPNALRGAGLGRDQVANVMERLKIEPLLRPENLTVEQWASISESLLHS